MDIVQIGPLYLGGAEMIFEKIEIQKYKKIQQGTKNVRNPHILRTLPILNFIGVSKIFLSHHMVWMLLK